MARKLILKENGLSNFTPPTGTKAIGYIGTTFSEKSQSSTNTVGSSGNKTPILNIENLIHTGTQSETIVYSMKVPSNYYRVGEVTSPYSTTVIGGYDNNGITPIGSPSPILKPGIYDPKYGELSYVVSVSVGSPGYQNQTLTFSHATSDGSGSGGQFLVSFDEDGYPTRWEVLNGGSNYVTNENITTDDLGDGTLSVYVYRTETSGDPNVIIRYYWSYTENGLDNLSEQFTLDYNLNGWRNVFNVSGGFNSASGWYPYISQITSNTNLKALSSQKTSAPYDFTVDNYTIPDITQDVWLTFTVELEDSSTSVAFGLIKLIDSVSDLAVY